MGFFTKYLFFLLSPTRFFYIAIFLVLAAILLPIIIYAFYYFIFFTEIHRVFLLQTSSIMLFY